MMPEFLWGVIGGVVGILAITIILYRRTAGFLYRIFMSLLVAIWFISAICILRTFWGQINKIVLLEIFAFAVFFVIVCLAEWHIAYRVAIKWCRKEFDDTPDSMSLLPTFALRRTFENLKKVEVRKGDRLWVLIISLNELKVISATKD